MGFQNEKISQCPDTKKMERSLVFLEAELGRMGTAVSEFSLSKSFGLSIVHPLLSAISLQIPAVEAGGTGGGREQWCHPCDTAEAQALEDVLSPGVALQPELGH